MENLEKQLETAIKTTLENGDYTAAADLVKALATLRNTANIEKTLNVFAELGEGLKQAMQGFNPDMLAKMQNQVQNQRK